MKKIALLLLFICFNILLGQVDYQTEIQTIFNANCTSCHINGGAYQQGLDLSSYDNLMAGSNNGPVIVPGDHANSLLWQKVNSGTMPPGDNPDLSSDEINLIAQWIDDGALENPVYAGPVWHVSTTGSDEDGDGSEENSFATIQKGIDESSAGDTVLVAAGTYVENINYNGKNIAIIGEDRETTIIDGNQAGSVVTFESGEDSTTLLKNFTVTNSGGFGENDWGGGIIVSDGARPILNSLIIDNNVGGGLYGNRGGGGLCVIENGSKPHLKNSIISNTSSENESGALFTCGGGAIKATNCLIANNNTYGVTAGCAQGSGNNTIELINCTVTDNSDLGIYAFGIVSVSNSIIYNNLNYNGDNHSYNNDNGTLTINNTLIQGGYGGEGNIDDNPFFCNPDNGDYTLAENSPCLGTGENGANMGAFGVGCDAIILAPVITDIDNQQIAEDGVLTIEVSATTDMGLDMTFSVQCDTSDVIVSLDNTTLTATPTPDWYGTANVTVLVTDENELSDTTDFILTVTPVNDSPEPFSVIYPAVSDTFSTHVDSDTAIAFTWEESYDVDSDVTYTLTIELEFFGNTYTDVHENISDTTISISSNSLDPMLNVISQDEAVFTYYVHASDEEYTVASDVGEFVLFRAALGVNEGLSVPDVYALHQNYPNPFNPVTTLQYDIPEDALVNITIYDMMGRVVSNLVSSQQNAGYKLVQWNATNDAGSPVSAGIYLYMIQAGEFRQTKKMVLLK